MFNLGKHDSKFVDPDFYVDPLDERFTGINNEIVITGTALAIGAAAGATAYAGYASAKASRERAQAARKMAEETRAASLREIEQMRSQRKQ